MKYKNFVRVTTGSNSVKDWRGDYSSRIKLADKKHHKALISDIIMQKRSLMKSDLLICELISLPFLNYMYSALVTISPCRTIGCKGLFFSLVSGKSRI